LPALHAASPQESPEGTLRLLCRVSARPSHLQSAGRWLPCWGLRASGFTADARAPIP